MSFGVIVTLVNTQNMTMQVKCPQQLWLEVVSVIRS